MKYINVVFLFSMFLILTASSLYAQTFQAFSLTEAKNKVISTPDGRDFRNTYKIVYTLGRITIPGALVFDSASGDVILIGARDGKRSPITLDDFVTALRSRFVHHKWPLVSFDPTDETEKTNTLRVRFEGGVKDTQMGRYLYDVDYAIKKLILGLPQPNMAGLKSYWDLGMEKMQENPETMQRMNSRLWFHPILCHVAATDDVIKPHRLQLLTGLLPRNVDGHKKKDSLSVSESAAYDFAKSLRENFNNLALHNRSFSSLESMAKLVAMAKAIEEIGKESTLRWWINTYEVKIVKTPEEVKVLTRTEEYRFQKDDKVHRGERRLSGGIQLKALVMKLKPASMEAFKKNVLNSRPSQNSLTWNVTVR